METVTAFMGDGSAALSALAADDTKPFSPVGSAELCAMIQSLEPLVDTHDGLLGADADTLKAAIALFGRVDAELKAIREPKAGVPHSGDSKK